MPEFDTPPTVGVDLLHWQQVPEVQAPAGNLEVQRQLFCKKQLCSRQHSSTANSLDTPSPAGGLLMCAVVCAYVVLFTFAAWSYVCCWSYTGN